MQAPYFLGLSAETNGALKPASCTDAFQQQLTSAEQKSGSAASPNTQTSLCKIVLSLACTPILLEVVKTFQPAHPAKKASEQGLSSMVTLRKRRYHLF